MRFALVSNERGEAIVQITRRQRWWSFVRVATLVSRDTTSKHSRWTYVNTKRKVDPRLDYELDRFLARTLDEQATAQDWIPVQDLPVARLVEGE